MTRSNWFSLLILLGVTGDLLSADNQLTEKEVADGWVLLFDGKSAQGWMSPQGKPTDG